MNRSSIALGVIIGIVPGVAPALTFFVVNAILLFPFFLLAIVAIMVFMSELTSNTAQVATMLPILKAADIVGKKILAQGPNERTVIDATLALAWNANVGIPRAFEGRLALLHSSTNKPPNQPRRT
mgnify:CR=1 FL=1